MYIVEIELALLFFFKPFEPQILNTIDSEPQADRVKTLDFVMIWQSGSAFEVLS
jgi:hypothetical protein